MFNPWIGSLYGQPTNFFSGRKLFVLGESHYAKEPELVGTTRSDFTTEAVEALALPHTNKTFRGISALLAGRAQSTLPPEKVQAVWDAIIFYNYVPSYVRRNTRPSNEQWRAGAAPFQQMLAEHKPDGVLVCGFGTWKRMVCDAPGGREQDTRALESFVVNGVPCRKIRHPSKGFDWRAWRPAVEALLQGTS
jgi:hypothetical protein